jgi:hypothetical protein
MEVCNFNHWLNNRENKVNEGLGDWISSWWNGKPSQSSKIPTPSDIDSELYSNDVKQYADKIIDDLGISSGTKLVQIDSHNVPVKGSAFVVGDWSTQNPNFYKALQRFVAAHVLGKGQEKAYLRVSQHDAGIIINTLDQYAIYNKNIRGSIVDEFQINTPVALSHFIQAKLPIAKDAVVSPGFDKASDEFAGHRAVRTGKGNPLTIPSVKKLADIGAAVIQSANSKSPTSRVGNPLRNAINQLDATLKSMGVKTSVIPNITGRRRTGKTGKTP